MTLWPMYIPQTYMEPLGVLGMFTASLHLSGRCWKLSGLGLEAFGFVTESKLGKCPVYTIYKKGLLLLTSPKQGRRW